MRIELRLPFAIWKRCIRVTGLQITGRSSARYVRWKKASESMTMFGHVTIYRY